MSSRPTPPPSLSAAASVPAARPAGTGRGASRHAPSLPLGSVVTTVRHRVRFYQTDAMGIMHHANYLHLLEDSRVAWLDEHDRPYTEYVAADLHFAVTRADLRYRQAARFDDELCVAVALEWLRGASLAMVYTIHRGDALLATAHTEHALVTGSGRPTRIPGAWREQLARLLEPGAAR